MNYPIFEKPTIKVMQRGSGALSDVELLASLLGDSEKAMTAAHAAFARFGGWRGVKRATQEELAEIEGITPARAAMVRAALEIASRVAREAVADHGVSSPEDAYALLAPDMASLPHESVRVILLNHRKKVIRVEEIFRGTGNECFANPAEILRAALVHSANSIVLAHNHPSGDPSPSCADHEVTKRLNEACKAVGIELTDHIIIGSPGDMRHQAYFSFRESGLL